MKKLISIFLALTLILGLATVASAASFSDNSWYDDDGQYDGWTLNADGSLTLTKSNGSGLNDDRIWHPIEDANNFDITINVKAGVNCCVAIRLFDMYIQLNAEGAGSDAFYVQAQDSTGAWQNYDWLNAAGFEATVKLVRENGGNMQVTVTGNGNATPITFERTIANNGSNNVELSMFRSQGGAATFTVSFGAEEPPVVEPPVQQGRPMTESGWWDDDGQYDGWVLNEDGTMTLVKNNGSGVNDDRIGHAIEDANNFDITVNVKAGVNSCVAIRLFDMYIQLNAEGAGSDAFYVQAQDSTGAWQSYDWLNAAGFEATVKLVRENGGNMQVTITGNGNATPITFERTIANNGSNNVELSMFRSQGCSATFGVSFGAEEPPVVEPPVDDDNKNPETGDFFSALPLALLVMSGAAVAVIIKKKEN